MALRLDQPRDRIRYTETGTYTHPPCETIKNVLRHKARIGVNKLEKIDPEITYNIPIYIINQPETKYKCHRKAIQRPRLSPRLSLAYGKGFTDNQSKASALMESLERYSAQINQSRIYEDETRYEYIDKENFNAPEVTPPKCWNCPELDINCYRTLDDFDRWVRGYSLTRDKPVMVPAAVTFYPYIEKRRSYIYNDTGGLASGNTLTEAIRNGVAEVIERDALYHTYNREKILNMRKITGVKGSKVINKFYNESIPVDRIISFKIKNPELKIRFITISSMVIVGQGKSMQVFGGSGTHLRPQVAMLRALTELVQQKIRKGIHRKIHTNKFLEWSRYGEQILGFDDFDYIEEELEIILRDLEKTGYEVLYVNLTDPRIGIPVVRVLIPGLVNYGAPFKYSLLNKIIEKYAA